LFGAFDTIYVGCSGHKICFFLFARVFYIVCDLVDHSTWFISRRHLVIISIIFCIVFLLIIVIVMILSSSKTQCCR